MSACACDACASSADRAGLCAFCDAHCFPRGRLRGKEVRISFSRASRAELHAYATGAPTAVDDAPLGPASVDPEAMAQHLLRRATEELASAARPHVERLASDAFGALRRTVLGKLGRP